MIRSLNAPFFSKKNQWFSVQKLRGCTIQIWKRAHLRTVHDKKFSSWGIYYICIRECALMNLNEKTCFRLLNAPFFIPHENWKNQEFVKWAWISKNKYWNCWKKGAFKLQLFVFSLEDKIVFKFRFIVSWNSFWISNVTIQIYFESLSNFLLSTQDRHDNFSKSFASILYWQKKIW